MAGKKYKASFATIDRDKFYGVEDAVKLIKAGAKAKFDETIEVAVNLNVDPRHADQMVRGMVTLPKGTGKTVRVGVFARGAKAEEEERGEERREDRPRAGGRGFRPWSGRPRRGRAARAGAASASAW